MIDSKRILVTTHPFGEKDPRPLEILSKHGINYSLNPYGRKLTEDDLIKLVRDYDVLIAGTEKISRKVLDSAKNLKLISRVGIGLDGIDLIEAKKRNIKVSYTPDAPSPAAAELTISLFLNLLRSVHISNNMMHNGIWYRHFGKRIENLTIGIIGFGRIGTRVVKILQGFGCKKILINDLPEKKDCIKRKGFIFRSKDEIMRQSDIVSLHLPLNKFTNNMITYEKLCMMKPDSYIVNISRGGIINEEDLFKILKEQKISGAAVDTFVEEPYNGPLTRLDNCILTSHMGSMSIDCRAQMEIEATKEAVLFITQNKTLRDVPQEEYEVQTGIKE